MKRTTIKDLAQQAGVNPSTISRALRDHPDISPALRQRVKQLAESLHYRPNHMAVYLRQRSSRLVGLIVPQTTIFFYPYLIRGIEHVLHAHGYSLIMLPSNELLEREKENVQICFDNDVAGLLIAFSNQTKNKEHLAMLEEAGAPIVMFDKVLDNDCLDSVTLDDFSDALQAVQYLVQTGCRRIAGVFGNLNMPITQRRLKGFSAGLKQCGLEVQPDYVLFADNPAEAEACTAALLKYNLPPDGIFAMSDEIITGVLPGLLDSGRQIPAECSVIGLSDGVLPHYLRPRVTFLRHDGYEIGRLAAERLCEMMNSGIHLESEYQARRTVVKSELVELDTTRKTSDAAPETLPASHP